MPLDQRQQRAADSLAQESSKEKMTRAHKNKNQHKQGKKEAAENLLASEFH
jgi:hypothetical protein